VTIEKWAQDKCPVHKAMSVRRLQGYTQRVFEKPEPHMPAHNPSSWLACLAPTTRSLPIVAGLAAVYFFAGKVGLQLAVVHPSATAVWPGTGIALAAILLF